MLKKILKEFFGEILSDIPDIKFKELHTNSKLVKDLDAFIAINGLTVDGHQFIPCAVEKGAKLLFVSKKDVPLYAGVGCIYIENLDAVAGKVAKMFYNYPEKSLKFIGITGTNGKTTTSFMIEQMMQCPVVKIGTVEYKVGDVCFEAPNTTPEPVQLTRLFNLAVQKGIEWVVMEVTSHALELKRVEDIEFNVAIFTNLTQDHLDFHLTMENYFEAKAKLFSMLKNPKNAVINIDDAWGAKLYERYPQASTFSLAKKATIQGQILAESLEGMRAELKVVDKTYRVDIPYLGEYNLQNVISTLISVSMTGRPLEELIEKSSKLKQVPGRFELIENEKSKIVVVDFAHTSDALENILSTMKRLAKGKIITVFGAGGDRDKTKRPLMAKVAAKYSDFVVVTSDNPRNEEPNKILLDVVEGLHEVKYPKGCYKVIESREEAISFAIAHAQVSDAVLIAGKGHEQYQIIGREKHFFSDQKVARKYLK